MKAEIEVVPCKICGDKSSGVHYGVITCEGCKGFFRRSQTASRPYQCQGNQNCAIERSNRNRCQYCRWKKCIELGMSRDAVKFGRMSKKQREKVEGEVNHHKELNSSKSRSHHSGSADIVSLNDVIQNALKNPSDQLSNGFSPQQFSPKETVSSASIGNGSLQFSNGNGIVKGYTAYNALSPVSSGYSSSSHASSPTPTTVAAPAAYVCGPTEIETLVDEKKIDNNKIDEIGSLTKLISTAHAHTSIYTPEQRQQLKMVPLDYATFWKYRNMTRLEWWYHGANQLTPTIQQIVEFAKLVPGFMKLPQDDQIMLLKGGAMDIAIIRMSTLYDLNSHTILYGGVYVPSTLFRSDDPMEQKFIYDLFNFVRELSSFALTETEIALYTAMVLMWPHRTAIKYLLNIRAIYQQIIDCMEVQLRSRHGDRAVPIFQRLLSLSGILQNLSAQHVFILSQFLKRCSNFVLPPLYKELFTTDH